MLKYTIMFAAVAGLVLALAPTAHAGVPITGATATASHDLDDWLANNNTLVDGVGLTGTYPNELHDTSRDTVWLGLADPATVWVKVDLGASYPLETLRVWNYNVEHYYEWFNGVKDVDIYYSATDQGSIFPGGWTLFGSEVFSPPAPPTPDGTPVGTWFDGPSDEIALGGIDARWVALDVQTAQPGNWTRAGLAELQFVQVPEPATMALLAFGGLGVLLRRRRRA